ncbi:MAG: hypothetical protein ACLPVY_09755, partial [Acidimicrobiia bacterium]
MLRDDLVRALTSATASRVTQIVAPVGYGKSVLLAQWAATTDSRVSWLDLESRDNQPTQFARSLVESLRRLQRDVGVTALERLSTTGASLGEDFVAALLDDLALLSDTVIVFDTFESIRNGALLADISQIIEHAPKDVHFVVAT